MTNIKEYSLGIFEKAIPFEISWKDKLSAAKSAGFDFVELSIDGSDERIARLDDISGLAQTINLSAHEAGIGVRSVSVSALRRYALGSADEIKRERGFEIAAGTVCLAEKIGARLVQIAGCDVCYEQSNEKTMMFYEENLLKIALEGAKRGVLIGIEPMETEYMDTVEKAVKCVKKIKSPYLGIYPDTSGLYNAALKYESDMIKDLNSGAERIIAIHCQETTGLSGDFLLFGEGNIDFPRVIANAWNLGVRRFTAEYVYKNRSNWSENISLTARYLRNVIDDIAKQ